MRILVLGAGRMGYGAAYDLAKNSPEVARVTVADSDFSRAREAARKIDSSKVEPIALDVTNYERVHSAMESHDAAISCVNYWFNDELSRIAVEAQTSFCDLGGNNSVVARQLALDEAAAKAGINIIPDCGLAPGMVSILAMDGFRRFDSVRSIRIRVGGLPQTPQPPLDYQLVFSVEGLINEYVESARVIRNGKIEQVESMTELEALEFEGFPPLEAFQTSGGTSTLPETFLGKVEELDYKTIRYSGHCEKFKAMIDLGLCSSEPTEVDGSSVVPRKMFGHLLETHLPADEPDLVLIRVEIEGSRKSQTQRLRYDIVDRYDETTGLSAMMRTTAFPASIIAQMMAAGDVARRGATPQELAVDPKKFRESLEQRGILVTEFVSSK